MLVSLTVGIFTHLNESYSQADSISFWFSKGIWHIIFLLLPLFLVLFAGGAIINLIQVGFLFSVDPLKPKWKSVNIFDISNFKKFFSTKAIMRLIFGVSKMTVLAVTLLLFIYLGINKIISLNNAAPQKLFYYIMMEAFYIGITTALILLILGVLDFIFQKWKYKKDLKMTKQEIKDERKQTEGDAHIKSKIRAMMQSFAQSRMKGNVKHSDVVIANPTHYAIAIKYEPGEMAAPVCLAKGMRKMALSIKELAKEHNIPIVENPPLAQGLYKVVEVGAYVPPSFYHSVAEILAYVYNLNERKRTLSQPHKTSTVNQQRTQESLR